MAEERPSLLADDYSKLTNDEQLIYSLYVSFNQMKTVCEHSRKILGKEKRKYRRLRKMIKLNLNSAMNFTAEQMTAIHAIEEKVVRGIGSELRKQELESSPLLSWLR